MAGVKDEQAYLNNLFILFYTLRHLRKLSGKSVSELYAIVFPSKSKGKGNKTLYDNILRLKDCKMLAHSKRLAELTGINEHYFTGEYRLSIDNISYEDWLNFIQLRKAHSDSPKGADLKQIESKIKEAIRAEKENPNSKNERFKLLAYFAEYGQRKANKTLEVLFKEIEEKVTECRPNDFANADIGLLENHQRTIQDYLCRIAATITIKKWKNEF